VAEGGARLVIRKAEKEGKWRGKGAAGL